LGKRDTGRLLNAWLKNNMVSLGEAGLNPREVILLSRNILSNLLVMASTRDSRWVLQSALLQNCQDRRL
jgi:hypothetical protein